jgi:diguanylate cyclase (GGDEF)-like protein
MGQNKNKTAGMTKLDIMQDLFKGQIVGGALSELANYSDLFMRMQDAAFLVDRHSHRVLECNPAGLQVLKRSESEVLGHELKSFFPGISLNLASVQSIEFKDATGSSLYFEISTTELKILDYIQVYQCLIKNVTDIKQARQELESANQALKMLSSTDGMTGLWNFRHFKETLNQIHHESIQRGDSYGVIFIDVDHFKKFNDRNGHPAGDEVLKKVASLLKQTTTGSEMVARYGGEEFVVLSPATEIKNLLTTAEKIRVAIESSAFPFGQYQPLGKVTVSMGVAYYSKNTIDPITPEEILNQADLALYQSKELGRNRVTLYSEQHKKKAA